MEDEPEGSSLLDALKEILVDFGDHVFVSCSREEVSENLLDYTADGDMERQAAMAGWKTQAEVANGCGAIE